MQLARISSRQNLAFGLAKMPLSRRKISALIHRTSFCLLSAHDNYFQNSARSWCQNADNPARTMPNFRRLPIVLANSPRCDARTVSARKSCRLPRE